MAVSKKNWTGYSESLGSLLNSETVWLDMIEPLTSVSFLITSICMYNNNNDIHLPYPSDGNIVSRLQNFTLTAAKLNSEEINNACNVAVNRSNIFISVLHDIVSFVFTLCSPFNEKTSWNNRACIYLVATCERGST